MMNRRHDHTTAVCVSLWMVRRSLSFVWFDCLLDLGMHFLIGNMVFVWDVKYLAITSHFHGLYFSLELCCEGPWFTNIQEDGCDKGAHQSYLLNERSTYVIPNWFQPCQCCCCLCHAGENCRLGTLISYNWAHVSEACDCLKLLSIYFDLCVDATGVVCHWCCLSPPKGGGGCLMSPPCLESQGCHLIPLCYLLSCSSA